MRENMPVYEPSRKHHWLKGWGNLCPKGVMTADAQALLDRAYRFEGVQHPDRFYICEGDLLFEAQATDQERGIWHGYPVLGSENTDVIDALLEQDVIDERTARRLRRQRRKPDRRGARLDRRER